MNTRYFSRIGLGLLAALLALGAHAAEETLDNPYGLSALWAQGDVVAKGTLTILVLMSIGSWFVIVTKSCALVMSLIAQMAFCIKLFVLLFLMPLIYFAEQ